MALSGAAIAPGGEAKTPQAGREHQAYHRDDNRLRPIAGTIREESGGFTLSDMSIYANPGK